MFVGREKELREIKLSLESSFSELIVVYGRRRVGKTFLIQHANNYKFDFSHIGIFKGDINNKNDDINLLNKQSFCKSLKKYGANINDKLTDWFDIFNELEKLLLSINKDTVTIFIDEFPWIADKDNHFLTAFAHFYNSWNNYTAKLLKVFICGSAANFLYKNFFQSPSELYKRETKKIFLSSFTLNECEQYFNSLEFGYSKLDILHAYFVFGGIPYYLKFFDRSKSALQNIDNLYFGKDSILSDEYDQLINTFFSSSKYYQLIFEALFEKAVGLDRKELLKILKITDSDYISNILNTLIQCDFIYKYEPLYRKNNSVLFKLKDHFILFHLYFKKFKNQKNFFIKNINTPTFNTWMGLTFEKTILNHTEQIKNKLGILAVNTKEGPFKGSVENIGTTQIDLLIDRADNVINLCEIKYSHAPLVIESNLINNFSYKELIFNKYTNNKKTVQYTLITTHEIIPNKLLYRINSYITLDDLFVKL